MWHFAKQTFLKGVFVFIPLFFLTFVALRALAHMRDLAQPVVDALSFERIAGVLVLEAMAILLPLALIFLLGFLVSVSSFGSRIWYLDDALGKRVPGYRLVRGIVSGKLSEDDVTDATRVLLADSGATHGIGLETGRTDMGGYVVFFPDVPNMQTGRVEVVDASRVSIFEASAASVIEALGLYGYGLTVPQEK